MDNGINDDWEKYIDDDQYEKEQIERLRTLRGKDCTYGNVAFMECPYIQARLNGQVVDTSHTDVSGRNILYILTREEVELVQKHRRTRNE